jgi:hypothetical protein
VRGRSTTSKPGSARFIERENENELFNQLEANKDETINQLSAVQQNTFKFTLEYNEKKVLSN